jgi:hypothetical protein
MGLLRAGGEKADTPCALRPAQLPKKAPATPPTIVSKRPWGAAESFTRTAESSPGEDP